MSALDNLGAAVEHALDECPVSDVLSILTGALVGLAVELVRQQGEMRAADLGALNFVTAREFQAIARAIEAAHGIRP